MKGPVSLTLAQARALHLAAQGLLRPARTTATPETMLACLRQMGVLQIDTISVVARSPYLVLWSRLGDYQVAWLDQALADGKLFEYWAHEACFVPIEDYRLLRHRMIDPGSMGWKYSEGWMRENPEQVQTVLAHIRQHGPTRSSDFKRTDGKTGGWWQWKPEKRALEVLFTAGHLMIARRHNFHRIYDLRERVLPAWHDAQLPNSEQTEREILLKSVKALGFAKAEWIRDYYRMRKLRPDPKSLVQSGALLPLQVQGWDATCYLHPDHLPLAEQAAAGQLRPGLTTLLSPFDPVVWDRRRALELFDFDYRIECYTPAAKRQYGYFTLPILRKGKLIGRVDAKAHRRLQRFEIISLHLQAGVSMSQALAHDLYDAFQRCATWHACPQIVLGATIPVQLGQLLQSCMEPS